MRTKPHTIYYTACMCVPMHMHRYRHGRLCVCVRLFQSILVLSFTFLTLRRLIVCLFSDAKWIEERHHLNGTAYQIINMALCMRTCVLVCVCGVFVLLQLV